MSLKWSSERPTVEGWYWRRFVFSHGESYPEIVNVWALQDKRLRVRSTTASCFLSNKRFDRDEWCGPLPLPEEPS